ncbi:MAG TPA: acyl carrier protein [Streptosporangiaceae bacterium]|jgi:acyl carrier protein
MDIEAVVREGLVQVLESETEPADINPEVDMAEVYGLTSLNKVIFLMSVCDDTNVSLAEFTEPDVARMRTVRDVVDALSEFTNGTDSA